MATATLPTTATPPPALGNPARSPEVLNLLVRLTGLALSLGMYSTALFIGERYSCLCPTSEEAIFLHALSHLRCTQARQAVDLLKNTLVDSSTLSSTIHQMHASTAYARQREKRPACEASVRCAWVFAEACNQLGRPNEGAQCLKRTFSVFGASPNAKLDAFEKALAPIHSNVHAAISVNLSLARLAVQANQPDVATRRFVDVLRAAWWCWEAYEGLCNLGAAPDAELTFNQIPIPAVPDPPSASFAPVDIKPDHLAISQNDSRASLPSAKPAYSTPIVRDQSVLPNAADRPPNPEHLRGKKMGRDIYEEPASMFRFSEAAQLGMDSNAPDMEDPLDMSALPNVNYGNDTSLFRPTQINGGAPRKGSASLLGNGFAAKGGLFGFGSQGVERHGISSYRPPAAPLFGSSLLFGAPKTAANGHDATRQPVASTSSFGEGFFTPALVRSTSARSATNAAEKTEALPMSHSVSQHQPGRPPPAIKRNHRHMDTDETAPSFHFDPKISTTGVNGNIMSERSASAESMEEEIVDGVRRRRARGNAGQGDSSMHGQTHTSTSHRASAITEAIGAGTNSTSSQFNVYTPDPPGIHRTVSNPRDRKRSRAGPSLLEGSAASSSHSYEDPDLHQSADAHDETLHTSSSSPPVAMARLPHHLHAPAHAASSTSMRAARTSSSGFAALYQTATNGTDSSYRIQLEAAQKALAENWLRGIYCTFAKAASRLSKYDTAGTVQAVSELPLVQQRCARASLMVARARFESLEYDKSEEAFAAAHAFSPHSLDDMDLYSTLLWHLHRPIQLSYLAQELMGQSTTSPQAWIATGNVFSHLQDHANALKCFKRATQCDSAYTYAHTLAGHECTTLEEWDTALGFFREAIKRGPRHYNAWFGMGNVYMRTGKYRMAEFHFRKAAAINPSNAMLACCVGTVLERLGQRKEALELYERACLLAPASPAVRFKRVRMLMDLRQYDSALRDLLIVRELAPDEFNVHYLLGKLYGLLGDKTSMTRSLTFAQDLEPRASGRIREIIERSGRGGSSGASDEEENGHEERGEDETGDSVMHGADPGAASEGEDALAATASEPLDEAMPHQL